MSVSVSPSISPSASVSPSGGQQFLPPVVRYSYALVGACINEATTVTFKSGSKVLGKLVATVALPVNLPLDGTKFYFPTEPGDNFVCQATAITTFRAYIAEFRQLSLG